MFKLCHQTGARTLDASLTDNCDVAFDTNDWWNRPKTVSVIGMGSMVIHARLHYTRDYLPPGICNLIKPAALAKLISFPTKITTVMVWFYYIMTVLILAGNGINFSIAAGLIRLHIPDVKQSHVQRKWACVAILSMPVTDTVYGIFQQSLVSKAI